LDGRGTWLPGGLLREEVALVPELQGLLWLGGQVSQDAHQQQALRELPVSTQLCAKKKTVNTKNPSQFHDLDNIAEGLQKHTVYISTY
jgi:tetraacyldisaccharide-1-P 4'-kinase